MQRQYTARERGQRVERLIAEECKKRKVSLTELRSGSRRGVIPAFRGRVSRKLVEDYGIPSLRWRDRWESPPPPFQKAYDVIPAGQ
jgi:hypothetical protein